MGTGIQGQKITAQRGSGEEKRQAAQNMHIIRVVAVSPLNYRSDNPNTQKSIDRFNADSQAIKCLIPGALGDGFTGKENLTNEELATLPNCFPLMPKHTNLVPKKGEMAVVMTLSLDEKFNDRFYIGPIISSPDKLKKDEALHALDNFKNGTLGPTEIIGNIPKARGIYENKQNVVIEGRDNTDIIQRSGEVLIRAGKFVKNSPLVFNSTNPGYIQIKSNFLDYTKSPGPFKTEENLTITNIVSNKINLISYDGSPNFSDGKGLTSVNKDGVAEYINEEKMIDILNKAEPLVFGNILVQYLILMKEALLNHCHNRDKAVDDDSKGEKEVELFTKQAKKLEVAMLSKNIRIN